MRVGRREEEEKKWGDVGGRGKDGDGCCQMGDFRSAKIKN